MSKKNVGLNAVLNVIKSLLAVVFPLITYPYAISVLGTINMGKISFSTSIIAYFALFASLGISTYAVREGAKKKETADMKTFANQVFSINVLSTLFMYILLIFFIIFVKMFNQYTLLFIIYGFTIFSTTLGVEWINAIYEDYLAVTIRTIITYCISIILIFVFVKNENDLYFYAGIHVFAQLISSIINWFYCRKYLKLKFTLNLEFRKHIKPILIFFSTIFAITIYCNIDITMLGIINGDYDVGIYSSAVKIYNIFKTLLASIYIVFIPKLTGFYSKNELTEYKKLWSKMFSIILILLLPVVMGLFLVSNYVMYFLGGEEYLEYGLVLQLLCVALLFSILTGCFSNCINICIGNEKIVFFGALLSAIINFSLNLFVLPKYSFYGAAFTTILSEAFALIWNIVFIKRKMNYMDFKCILPTIIKCLISVLAFSIYVIMINKIDFNIYLKLIVTILGSVFIYFILLLFLKEKNIIMFLKNIKCKLFKNKNLQ